MTTTTFHAFLAGGSFTSKWVIGFFPSVTEIGNALHVRYSVSRASEWELCSRKPRWHVTDVEYECKINFIIFNHCSSGIVCYHRVTYPIRTDTGTEIREIKSVSQFHTASISGRTRLEPRYPDSRVWLLFPLWHIAYLYNVSKLELRR